MLPSHRLTGLVLLLPLTLATVATAQKFRTINDDKKGFKLKMLKWVKDVPNQPLEEQILAKFSGVKKSRVPKDQRAKDAKKRDPDPVLEFWVVHIPKKGPITQGGKQDSGADDPKDIAEQRRRSLNAGRNPEEFLKRRLNPT